MRKTYYNNRKHKRAEMATVTSDKMDLGQKIFLETKKRYFIITESICQKKK